MAQILSINRNNPLAQNIKVLSRLFTDTHLRENFLSSVVGKLRDWTDCQCVGVRVLDRKGEIPYESYVGFSYDFWKQENLLSIKEEGHECVCLRMATGNPDPLEHSLLTESGSLWSNDLKAFGEQIPAELRHRYRGKCLECGFQSMAILPIRQNTRIIGLIHLADQRKDMLSRDKILILESVAPAIGEVILRFKSEEALARKEEFSARLIESMFDGFTVLNAEGVHIDVNNALCHMTGFSREELLGVGLPHPYWPKEGIEGLKHKFQEVCNGSRQTMELEFMRKSGKRFPVLVSPSHLVDEEGKLQCYFATIKDVSDLEHSRQELAEKVQELSVALEKIQELAQQLEQERDLAHSNSLTDSMTGLPNRRFFDQTLRSEFLRHKRSGSQLSLIMLDVDFFKRYNDEYGHLKGDECLRQIARVLQTQIDRSTDLLARYGGEEFVLILPYTDLHGAQRLARQLGEAVLGLELAHVRSDVSPFVTISLGVATTQGHILEDPGQLVALADQALYRAKSSGRNCYELLTLSPAS